MLNKILSLLFLLILSTGSLSAQTKVGTTGANELMFSPSTVANGMGETGASLVNAKSMYYNPGSLGLFALENKITVSGYLKKTEYYDFFGFYNASLSFPLQKYEEGNQKFVFAYGEYYAVLKTLDPIVETTYEFPEGTGRTYSLTFQNYNSVLSVAYINKIRIGAGLTIKKIEEEVFDFTADGFAFDVGILVQYPILPKQLINIGTYYCIPSIGFSILNMGNDLDYGWTSFQLPKKKLAGLSLESGYLQKDDDGRNFKIISVRTALELYKIVNEDWYNKLGVEFGLFEALYLRMGFINRAIIDNVTSHGFSLDSGSLLKLLQNSSSSDRTGINSFFTDWVSLHYSYAKNSEEQHYHELLLTYAI